MDRIIEIQRPVFLLEKASEKQSILWLEDGRIVGVDTRDDCAGAQYHTHCGSLAQGSHKRYRELILWQCRLSVEGQSLATHLYQCLQYIAA